MSEFPASASKPVSVMVDTRWKRNADGIGRYAREICDRLGHSNQLATIDYSPSRSPLSPFDPFLSCLNAHQLKCGVFYSPGFNVPVSFPGNSVFTIHDLIHLSIKEEASLTKRLYYEVHLKRAVKAAFKVLTVSEYSKSEIVSWAHIDPEKVVVAPNGVSELFNRNAFSADLAKDNYFLYIGNHKPHKNIMRMLNAFYQAKLPDGYKLYLSGTSTAEETALVNDLGLQSRVKFLGFIDESDLPALYASARALVFVSLLEGFGLPALEAMACGTPVIAANNSSLPEIIGPAGILVDPYSVDDIAGALQSIATNEELAKSLGLLGCQRAAQFTWDKSYKIIEHTLMEAANHAK